MESENSGKVMGLVKHYLKLHKKIKEMGEEDEMVESYSERKKEKTVKSYLEMESGKVLESARKSLIKGLEEKGYLEEETVKNHFEEMEKKGVKFADRDTISKTLVKDFFESKKDKKIVEEMESEAEAEKSLARKSLITEADEEALRSYFEAMKKKKGVTFTDPDTIRKGNQMLGANFKPKNDEKIIKELEEENVKSSYLEEEKKESEDFEKVVVLMELVKDSTIKMLEEWKKEKTVNEYSPERKKKRYSVLKKMNEYCEEMIKKLDGEMEPAKNHDNNRKAIETLEGCFESEIAEHCEERYPVCEEKKDKKRKLEDMESANHENFGKVMKILKSYREEKKTKKKKEVEEEEDKKMRSYYQEKMKELKEGVKKERMMLMMRGNNNGAVTMKIVGRDSNGKFIQIPKSYAEAKREQKLRQEEERKRKIANGEPEETPPVLRPPRWSDENMAVHVWTGLCRSKGMEPQKYVIRNDHRNMTREEVKLDMLFRKVYKAKEEAAAAAATATATTTS